jgi:hypothetical protein
MESRCWILRFGLLGNTYSTIRRESVFSLQFLENEKIIQERKSAVGLLGYDEALAG